jgi:glycosyltransferase involved in cell wall biosynthesis
VPRRLRIRRPSFFGIEPELRPTPSPDTTEVRFPEVKQWILDGRVARHVFRYSEVELLTHRIDHISKPFLAALLVRGLSHGRAIFRDDSGDEREIGAGSLLEYLLGFLGDLLRLPVLVLSIWRRIGRLEKEASGRGRQPALDLSRPPLYLRSDLVFGLESGGSVGHIAGVLNHLGEFTGPPVFVTTDLIPTVRSDIETHVVVPGSSFCGFEEAPGIHFNRLFSSRARKALAGRPVSFVYQRYGLYNLTGLELASELGAPFVLEYNGSEVWISRNWGKPLRFERTAKRIENVLLRAADLIVVVSRPLRDDLVGRGIPGYRVLVNPNGVDPTRYSPDIDGTPVRRSLGLEGKRVLGFIGTFGRWHGAELLAEAFGRLMARRPEWRASVRLLMIGDGLTMAETRQRLDRHDVEDLAVLTGRIPQELGPGHLAACDILIAPHVANPDGTPFFGSPTKVFEYMAMGKAIVASRLDQIGEVLRHGETAWMYSPGDLEGLTSAVEHLLLHEPLAQSLGTAARRDVVERHTWREHTRRIVERLRSHLEETLPLGVSPQSGGQT